MDETVSLGGLNALSVGSLEGAESVVVLAHGFEMVPEDLSPFARSLGVPALFLFPEGPLLAPTRGRAWWEIDMVRRQAALDLGPRDLFDEHPPGLADARARFAEFLRHARTLAGTRRLVVGGFSQGGMLTMETLLRTELPLSAVDRVVLLSTSRIAFDTWSTPAARQRAASLRVLLAHGRADDDLSFAAGEALRDFLISSGANVTWFAHDGGHQIPLPVWRAMKRFLREPAS